MPDGPEPVLNDPPDVRLLQALELPRGDFPGGEGQVFRVYFAPEVHEALWKHAAEDTSVEICGVLVGAWERDSGGPFVRISESVRGEAAASKFAEVTFTHETWAKINREMDTRFSHLAIVGWYHTHPDFGIFLSDRDRFIHEHFFANPGQVAHVIDPVRKTEGVFVWREGKPALAPHFWVGGRVEPCTAAGAERSRPPAPDEAPRGAPARPPVSDSSLSIRLMAYGCVFLLGFLLAGRRSEWEQQRLAEGVVAHFGIWKGLRPGLREELDAVQNDLAVIARALDNRDAKKAEFPWREVRARLARAAERIAGMKAAYAYTDREQAAIQDVLDRIEALGKAPAKPPAPVPVPTPEKKP